MSLSTITKKNLKAKAHHLNPIILVGHKGIAPNLLQEIETALDYHELIKIKIQQGDKTLCEELSRDIIAATAAQVITQIGRVLVLYRKKQ